MTRRMNHPIMKFQRGTNMMETQMVDALIQECKSKIEMSKCNVWIYLHNPVGVGDHANIMETIQGELDTISQNKDRLNVLETYFHDKY